MFTEITWATYLRVTAAILFIYYTALLLKSYFPQIRAGFPNGTAGHSQLQPHAQTASGIAAEKQNLTPNGEFEQQGHTDYDIIEEMVDRVKAALKEASEANADEETLTERLRKIVNDYPLLAKSTFRPSINEFIATESQQHGFLFITEAVADQLWRTE